MSHSLNEVEATAKRAARGAGFCWGLAEEAGKAARWLCANGLDGCGILARLLDDSAGEPLSALSPKSLNGEWSSPSGRLCSLMAGVALSDCASRLEDGDIIMSGVMHPALILPFGASAAQQSKKQVSVSWDGLTAMTNSSGVRLVGATAAFTSAYAVQVLVRPEGTADPVTSHATRTTPDAEHWATLNRFAHRTYAPATEASRLLGAGAGLSDHD